MTPAFASGIRDNHKRGIVADFLRSHIKQGSRLSVVSAFFTIYAYDLLKDYLDQIDSMDFLFGEPRFVGALDPDKTEKKSFVIEPDGLKLARVLQQKRVARECADWIREKVSIKSIKHTNFLHGKLYHVSNGEVCHALVGSSNFTSRGLGLSTGNSNIELNLVVDSDRDRDDLKAWFVDLWNDPNLVDDVKAAMSGLLAPTLRETMLGNALILEVFDISKVGKVAGCRITDGKVERGANVRLIRDNVVVHEGKLSTLKRFKDEVKEVDAGQECGMAFENYQDMRQGDVIECYRVEEIKRTL